MGHSAGGRVNEKGMMGIFKCRDCGEEMSAAQLMTTECEATERTSPEATLLDAIDAPEGETVECPECDSGDGVSHTEWDSETGIAEVIPCEHCNGTGRIPKPR